LTELAIDDEQPHWDSSIADAGLPATDVGCLLDVDCTDTGHDVPPFLDQCITQGPCPEVLNRITNFRAKGPGYLKWWASKTRPTLHNLFYKSNILGREVATLAAINDKNLTELLTLAYRASFKRDEGRPIRGRIAVQREVWMLPREHPKFNESLAQRILAMQLGLGMMKRDDDHTHHAYRFISPMRLFDHKPLVKLASLLLDSDGAITVKEVNEELSVTGLAFLERGDLEGDVLKMPRLRKPTSGLLVEIVGPGHLRVSEGGASFTLEADKLVTHGSLWVLSLYDGGSVMFRGSG
jgi:hypothetical protein